MLSTNAALVKKWFIKQINAGKNYTEILEILFSYRTSNSKEEVRVYEEFCYMDDEEWNEIKTELF